MTARRVCLGAFAGAHGVKGHAKLRAFTETEEAVAEYGAVESEDGARRFSLTFVRMLRPGVAIVSAPEIADRDDAAALTGMRLYVERAALPALAGDDEFYMEDLVGLNVVDENGANLGRIAGIHNFGAGDIVEIAGRPGRSGTAFAPFTKAAFPRIDLVQGVAFAADEAKMAIGEAPDAALVAEAMRQEDA